MVVESLFGLEEKTKEEQDEDRWLLVLLHV